MGSEDAIESVSLDFEASGDVDRLVLEGVRSFGVLGPDEGVGEEESLFFESCSFQKDNADAKPLCFFALGASIVSSGGVGSKEAMMRRGAAGLVGASKQR